jgi:holin-like protein
MKRIRYRGVAEARCRAPRGERAAGDRPGGSLLFFADFDLARPASRLDGTGIALLIRDDDGPGRAEREREGIGMRRAILLAIQLAALLLISKAGYAAATALSLPVPGNLLGMLLLLGLLASGAVRMRWIEGSAALLLRHLAFFFVPITVGLMGFTTLLASDGAAILLTLIVSAAIGLCVAGFTSQALVMRSRRGSR